MAFDPERWPSTSETCAANVFATAADATRDDEPECWTARISETFVPLHARPLETTPFYGELRTLQRGPLLVACITGSAQDVRHGHREIAAQDKAAVYLNLQLHGMGQVRNHNAEMRTIVGSGAVVPSDEPFTLRFKESFCQLCVAMPADWFADRLGFPATTLQRRHIDTERGIGRVVRAAIDAVVEAADPEESVLCGELFGQTLATALRGPASDSDFADNRPDVLLSAIGPLIRRRLAEIDLTPAKAAAALGCSPSTCTFIANAAGAVSWQCFGRRGWTQRRRRFASRLPATAGSKRWPSRAALLIRRTSPDASRLASACRRRFTRAETGSGRRAGLLDGLFRTLSPNHHGRSSLMKSSNAGPITHGLPEM